ncbi:methyl-accepting chemotaxis protein [Undibacterium sp. Ji22W]|uniref:methyl-accepting chemotaxis protein n=1 Tax=Undibacterium sp. Ji22W TaxID=3413038 RepID=UPI003BF2591A
MQFLFSPAITLMRQLRLLPKFLMVACLFALPALIVSGLFVYELNKAIGLNKLEQGGLQNLRIVQELSLQTQQHQALRHLALAGNVKAKQAALEVKREIDKGFQRLVALQAQYPEHDLADASIKALIESIKNVQSSWTALQQALDTSKAKESYAAHNGVLLQLKSLSNMIADQSNLSLDPQVDTYYLIALYAKSLPELTSVLADTAARGAPYIDTGLLEANEDVLINANVLLSQRDLPKVQAQLEAIVKAYPALQNLQQQQQQVIANHLAFLERTKTEILNTLNQTSGTDYLAAGQKSINAWHDLSVSLADLIHSQLEQRLSNHVWNRNAIVLAIALIISIATYLLAGFYLAFARELGQLTVAVHRIRDGNLSIACEAHGKDEVAQLVFEFESMRQVLIGLVQRIRSSTEQIASSSKGIARGNADLSMRTEQQASSLEETSSSMEELTSTVKQNIQSAQQANAMAIEATTIAGHGGNAVAQMNAMMTGIQNSSKQITDIIAVIDSIAFQTNILALNAAVEAARAGEQGRGFAVVATEVRNLAQRSAGAAKEIKILIGNSVQQVNAGHQQVQQAGNTMTQIVDAIAELNRNMQAITDASVEQGDGIQMVNSTIGQLDHITQQNAALVEHAAAAAENMHQQALRLSEAVSVFVTEDQLNAQEKDMQEFEEHSFPSAPTSLQVPTHRAQKQSARSDKRKRKLNDRLKLA